MATYAERPLLRNLPRLLLIVAAIGYLTSALLPWATGVAVGYPQQYVASEAGEGVWMVLVAAALFVLGVSDILWDAMSRLLQLLPAALLVVSAVMWLGADTQAQFSINDWIRQAGAGEMTAVRWIGLGALAANGLGWLLFELWRPSDARIRTQRLSVELGFNWWAVATLVAAAVLGTGGAVFALYEVIVLLGPKASIVGLLLAVLGLFVGGWVGVRLIRLLRTVVDQRSAAAADKRQ